MSFSQGVSGLNSASANLDVIGNNIANAGTVGYKSGSAQFSNVYAGSMQGLGTKVAGIFQDFTAGAVQTSTSPLDVAIVDGNGFFRMTDPSGGVGYTRNGQFTMDKEGYIVNSSGLQLTGYSTGTVGTLAAASAVPLQVPTAAMPPAATSLITAQFNIDARSTAPATTPFSATDSNSYNYSNSVSVFDSLGNSHELSAFFVKSAAPAVNTWDVYATGDGRPLLAAGGMATVTSAAGVVPVTYSATAGKIGTIGFDTSGKLITPVATGTDPLGTISFANLDFLNGSAKMNFKMQLDGSTQFGADNAVKKMAPDGYASGQLTTLAVGADGTLTGKYSNQQTKVLGQIVLSSFSNMSGLQNKGNNVWAETQSSGAPLTGTPGTGKTAGSLLGGAVEGSNVDLTTQLINLIVAQRTYQANAQTIKTQDQVMQTLVNGL